MRLLLTICNGFIAIAAEAHSGGLAKDGCHIERITNTRHCHEGKKVISPVNKVIYDRSDYGEWLDVDRDCRNTRHELLAELSTGQVIWSKNGCHVVKGRWRDPYSGQTIFLAKALDIDHLVALAWAHRHGASNWSKSRKEQFSNDPVNLIPVKFELNRSKGALGPDEWMPPNGLYHCQYIFRFIRIIKKYELKLDSSEQVAFNHIISKC